MRTLRIPSLLLAVCCSALFATDEKEAKWILAKDEENIKVYTRKVEGTNLKEFKGVVTIKASLTSLVVLVSDAAAAPEWLANCSETAVLKQISTKEFYTYSLSKAPWPVADRDSIVHNLISQDRDTLVVTIKQTGKPDRIKEKKNITRVKRIEGVWQFTPKKDGNIEIVYQNLSDPGGAIPVWLVNSSLVSQPYGTLIKLQEVVKREKYQNATLEFVVEPEA